MWKNKEIPLCGINWIYGCECNGLYNTFSAAIFLSLLTFVTTFGDKYKHLSTNILKWSTPVNIYINKI
jgi:hypothetical protein